MNKSAYQKLEILVERFEEVQALLSDPETLSNQEKFLSLSREFKQLDIVTEVFKNYQGAEDNLAAAEEMLKDVGYTSSEIPSIKCQKGTGCDKCEGSGYKGRQGIYEFLEITNKLGQGIIEGLRSHELLEVAKKDGFVTMEERARMLVKNGILSYEEFLRVISISH